MNHLIAKVKERNKKYRKVNSDCQYFDRLEFGDTVAYSPETVLEEGQWYVINDFCRKAYCLDFLKEDSFDSTEYDLLSSVESDKIQFLCAYQESGEYYFQRIYKSNVLSNKNFLHMGDNIRFEKGKDIIVINQEPDALYLKEIDCLYFKKLETIAPIFKGIDCLYKEATEGEVEIFLQEPFIKTSVDFTAKKVGKANRKRLALVRDTLRAFNQQQKRDVFKYTNEYYPELGYDGNSFEIKSDNDLKNLLLGVEERFYTTPITHKKRAANSVIAIP